MRCPGCQTENDPGAKFCTECGLPLPVPTPPPAVASPEPPSGGSPTQSAPRNEPAAAGSPRKGKPKRVVPIVIAVVIVLLCVFFFLKGRNPKINQGAGRGDDRSAVGASDAVSEDAVPSGQETTSAAASAAETTEAGPNGAAERDFTNLFGYWWDKIGPWELYVTADGQFTFSTPSGLFSGYVDRETDGYGMYLSDGTRLNGDAQISFPEGSDDLLVYRSQFFEVSLYLTHYDGYPATQRTVWITPPGELLSQYPAYEQAVIDDTEYAAEVLLQADYPVRDLKVLSLELKDVSQDGKITFEERDAFTMPVLFPSRPLLLKVAFEGSIPTRGISYVDADGVTRRFTLSLSGEDGSCLLTEY